jgi:hypothetical protein
MRLEAIRTQGLWRLRKRGVTGGIPSQTCREGQRVVFAMAVEMISQMHNIDDINLTIYLISFSTISQKDETSHVDAGITQSDKIMELIGGPMRCGCGQKEKNERIHLLSTTRKKIFRTNQ